MLYRQPTFGLPARGDVDRSTHDATKTTLIVEQRGVEDVHHHDLARGAANREVAFPGFSFVQRASDLRDEVGREVIGRERRARNADERLAGQLEEGFRL